VEHGIVVTLPLTMPRLRERRAGALLEVVGGPSDMPSGPFGLESRPPMLMFTIRCFRSVYNYASQLLGALGGGWCDVLQCRLTIRFTSYKAVEARLALISEHAVAVSFCQYIEAAANLQMLFECTPTLSCGAS
jgi:hypothetical protein